MIRSNPHPANGHLCPPLPSRLEVLCALLAPWEELFASHGLALRWHEAPDGVWLYVDEVYCRTLSWQDLKDLATAAFRAAWRGEGG